MSVNKANIRKWVEALRSGRYKQGKQRLRQGDTFCCLGVACDVSGLGEWSTTGAYVAGQTRQESLPARVRDWLGLKAYLPHIKVNPGDGLIEVGLSEMNDNWGWGFSQIADEIEKFYLAEDA